METKNPNIKSVYISEEDAINDFYCIEEIKRIAKIHLNNYLGGSTLWQLHQTIADNWQVYGIVRPESVSCANIACALLKILNKT